MLISHLHLDHLDVPSLRLLPRGTPLVVPRGAGRMLHRRGFADVRELAAGESTEVGGRRGARRRRGPRPATGSASGRRPTRSASSRAGRVYFAGDTDLFDEMADLAGIDVALIPVWGWGPSLGHGHLDPQAAARAAALVRPRVAVPIHWGTFFPRFMHLWKSDRLTDPPHEFAAAVARLAPEVDVRVLPPGGSTRFGG